MYLYYVIHPQKYINIFLYSGKNEYVFEIEEGHTWDTFIEEFLKNDKDFRGFVLYTDFYVVYR